MTEYTGFGAGTPSGIGQDSDSAALDLATRFHVTSTGMSLKNIRLYIPTGAGSPPISGYYGYVWAANSGGATGDPLAVVDFGTITLDAWNEAELDTWFPLTSGTDYYVGVYFDAFIYGFISGKFSSAVTNGPLVLDADSGTTPNGAFDYGVNGTAPTSTFGSSWYGIDLTVTDATQAAGAHFVSASQIVAVSGTSTTGPMPPVFAADDILIMHVMSKATSSTISDIAGWTGLTQVDNGTTMHERTFYRIATGGDSAPTVSQTASQLLAAVCTAWRGCDTTTPLDVATATGTGTSTTMTCPTVTTVTDGAKIIRLTASGDDNYHQDASEGQLIYGADAYNTTTGSDGSLGMSHYSQTTHGTTGTATITQGGNGPDVYVARTIALRPASTSTPATAIPSAVAATAAISAVTATGTATLTPSAIAATTAAGAPTIAGTATIATAAVVAAAAIPAATIIGSATITPATATGITTISAPNLTAATDVTFTAATATAAIPAITFVGGADAAAVTTQSVTAVAAPTITGTATVQPSAVPSIVDVGSPAIMAGGGATISPLHVAATAAIPAPTVTGTVSATPGNAQAAAATPAAIVAASVTASAADVAAAAAVPAPMVTGSTLPAATAVAAIGVNPTPTVIASVGIPTSPVPAKASIPSVNISGTTARATSTAVLTARRASLQAVTARRTGTGTVTVRRTSTPTLGG